MALSKDLHFEGIKSCYLQCKAQVLITNVVFCLSSVITVLHLTQQHITLVKRLRYILDCHLHSHWLALPTEILTLNSPTEKITQPNKMQYFLTKETHSVLSFA